MLNTAHPERQACVGNRANGPTNDTKINLYKTVQRFLESDIGERFFSQEHDAGERWVYTRDETALISLLTPLMRRMVTNERQRQYARKTRAALQQQQAQSRNQSPSQTNGNEHVSLQPGNASDENTPPPQTMEIFYLQDRNQLFHRHVMDTSIDYATIHDRVVVELTTHNSLPGSPSGGRKFKIYVHGARKLEPVDSSNWISILDELQRTPWTAHGPIRMIVQLE